MNPSFVAPKTEYKQLCVIVMLICFHPSKTLPQPQSLLRVWRKFSISYLFILFFSPFESRTNKKKSGQGRWGGVMYCSWTEGRKLSEGRLSLTLYVQWCNKTSRHMACLDTALPDPPAPYTHTCSCVSITSKGIALTLTIFLETYLNPHHNPQS